MIVFDKNRLLSELDSIYIAHDCTNHCWKDCDKCEEQEEKIKEVKQFILEYFNPTPLKYKDLYKGMWIYDSVERDWKIVYGIKGSHYSDNENIIIKDNEFEYGAIGLICEQIMKFEENRFYLKELEE